MLDKITRVVTCGLLAIIVVELWLAVGELKEIGRLTTAIVVSTSDISNVLAQGR